MDKSEQYIKMSDKAKEIQALRPEWNGEGDDGEWWISKAEYQSHTPQDAIWLPRQDQMQEILKKRNTPLLMDFTIWVYEENKEGGIYDKENQFTSMEQLWLAFVMKEKYKKTWDGENWQVS